MVNLSEFDSIYYTWNNYLESNNKENKINTILEGNNLMLFFIYNKKIFGSPEESRLLFAKMKTKDEDITKDSSFMGYNLEKAMLGREVIQLFKMKDLPKIQVISKLEAKKILDKLPANEQIPNLGSNSEEDNNDIYLKDKKENKK